MVKKDGQSNAALDLRRRRVLDLYLEGLGPREISKELKVPERTVYRDVEELQQDLKQQRSIAILYPLKEHVQLQRLVIRRAWQIYKKPDTGKGDDYRKMMAMQLVNQTSQNLAGLLAPLQVEGDIEDLRVMAEDQRKQIAALRRTRTKPG